MKRYRREAAQKISDAGAMRLITAVVRQAFDDCEGILKAEYGRKVGREIPGSIRSDPKLNLKEIRAFMKDGVFTYFFDADGEAILDRYIHYARTEKIPKECKKYE